MKVVIFSLLMILIFTSSVPARIGGGDINFEVKAMGNVKFSHDTHVGFPCTECHQSIFESKVQAAGPHKKQGKACVVCHNGKKAFNFTANCTTCHQKGVK